MATGYGLHVKLQLLNGAVVDRNLGKVLSGVCGESSWNELSIPANATGLSAVEVSLGGLTAPKMVLVLGARGISMKTAGGVDSYDADPLAVFANSTGLVINPSPLTIENSDTVPHTITVVAIE